MRQQFPDAATQQLFRADTEQFRALFVDVGEAPITVQREQTVGDAVHHVAKFVVGLAQRLGAFVDTKLQRVVELAQLFFDASALFYLGEEGTV